MVDTTSCPCGSGQSYADCCGRYIESGAVPITAEQLMRSRYCAYVTQSSDYLLRTWDPDTRPVSVDFHAEKPIKWLGLKILATEGGSAVDVTGIVGFIARHKINGKAVRLHERSSFRRVAGQWYYVDGHTE